LRVGTTTLNQGLRPFSFPDMGHVITHARGAETIKYVLVMFYAE